MIDFPVFKVLERDFDPQIHGHLEFAVHFGRVYLFSVPHVLLEDGESITIAMLRANKRKVAMQQTRRNAPSKVTYVDEEEARERRRKRKPNRAVQNEENRKKRKRGNPSRSSFYTVVRSLDRVKNFLLYGGFQPERNPTERYAVDICTCDEGDEFYVRLDKDLSFINIKFPNLRWCMTDVKRQWRPRPNNDTREGLVSNDAMSRNRNVGRDGFQGRDVVVSSVNTVNQANDDILLDGWESDIRFLLQSRNALPAQDIRGTKYERYQCVLKASNPGCQRPFSVQEDLWKDVKHIRSIKSTKFTYNGAQGGRLSDLTVYLDEVTEYSRPGPCDFTTETTRWEVSLEAGLPEDLTEKETVKTFLHEVWEFSMSLSSFVSSP